MMEQPKTARGRFFKYDKHAFMSNDTKLSSTALYAL